MLLRERQYSFHYLQLEISGLQAGEGSDSKGDQHTYIIWYKDGFLDFIMTFFQAFFASFDGAIAMYVNWLQA